MSCDIKETCDLDIDCVAENAPVDIWSRNGVSQSHLDF